MNNRRGNVECVIVVSPIRKNSSTEKAWGTQLSAATTKFRKNI